MSFPLRKFSFLRISLSRHRYWVRFSFLIFTTSLVSCVPSAQDDSSQLEVEMSKEQIEAFDALNSLQRNTQGHLFSTFIDAQNAYEDPDTAFILSKEELKAAISRITSQYGENLSEAEFNELARASVLAQNEYHVEYYGLFECAEKIGAGFKGYPTTGKWIIRGILKRRDLVLEW